MIELIASLAGLVVPPAFDFLKKKFLKPKDDSQESTLSSLAVTNPDVMPEYVKANADLLRAQVDYKNWDVVGNISAWVSNLRASIRPIFVIASLLILAYSVAYQITIDPSFKALMDVCISSWFGSRLT